MRERPILFTGAMVRGVLDGTKTQTRRVVTAANTAMGCGRWTDVDIEGAWADPGLGEGGYLHAPVRDDGYDDRSYRCYSRIRIGDRLWVREAWRVMGLSTCCGTLDAHILHEASNERLWMRATDTTTRTADEWITHLETSESKRAAKTGRLHGLRPSIYMPRWASRLLLTVTDIRVERVCDISDDDARAEGVAGKPCDCGVTPGTDCATCMSLGLAAPAQAAFRDLWDSLYERRGLGWATDPWVWAVSFEVAEDWHDVCYQHGDRQDSSAGLMRARAKARAAVETYRDWQTHRDTLALRLYRLVCTDYYAAQYVYLVQLIRRHQRSAPHAGSDHEGTKR